MCASWTLAASVPCGGSDATSMGSRVPLRLRARTPRRPGAQKHPHPAHQCRISDLDRDPLVGTRSLYPRSDHGGRQMTQPHANHTAGGPCHPSTLREDHDWEGLLPMTASALVSSSSAQRPVIRIARGWNP